MWTAVAVAGLLGLMPGADADPIKITNARFTYGPFGMERTEARFLPGDVAYLAYNIENASVDKTTGKVVYALTMSLTDSKGKLIIKRDNSNVETFNAFNSSLQPSFLELGIEQAPGKYVLELTVSDRITKKKATLKKEFEVARKELGFIRIGYPAPAPVVNLMGPAFTFNFTLIGYQLDAKKLPQLTVKFDVLDEKNTPTLKNPIVMNLPKDLGDDVDPDKVRDYLGFPVSFPLNRPGKFTLWVEAHDRVADKKIKFTYTITVLDPRKYETPAK